MLEPMLVFAGYPGDRMLERMLVIAGYPGDRMLERMLVIAGYPGDRMLEPMHDQRYADVKERDGPMLRRSRERSPLDKRGDKYRRGTSLAVEWWRDGAV